MQPTTSDDWNQRHPLGQTDLNVSRIGIGSSYGVGAAGLEEAYHEHGINYLYWGTFRKPNFGTGIQNLALRHRDDLVIALQTYSRMGSFIKHSLYRAFRKLKIEYTDILILGMFNKPPHPRIIEAALQLRDKKLIRHLAISCHHRPTFEQYISEGIFNPIMFRYNAAHRGAESDIFPHLNTPTPRPGTIVYTATRWAHLIDSDRMPEGEHTPSASDCYRFVLSHPEVDVCLTGPANRDQLKEAIRTLSRGRMDADELAWMHRVGDHVHHQPLGSGLRNRMRSWGGTGA